MTVSSAQPSSLIFDTTVLSHFARADRLDVLADLVGTEACYTTQVVRQELVRGASKHQELSDALTLDWLDVIGVGDRRRSHKLREVVPAHG